MFRSVFIASVCVTLLAACGKETSEPAVNKPTPTQNVATAPVTVSAPTQGALAPEFSSSLDLEGTSTHLHDVRSLFFQAGFVDGAAHELAVEFRAPGDFVYQRWTSAVAAGQTRAEFHLPVAGASIDLDGLAGDWEARVFVDGVAVASHGVQLVL